MKRVDFTELRRRHMALPNHLRAKSGWKLKHWRLQNELSQAQAAKLFGCSQPVLSQYELGERSPQDPDVVAKIRARTGIRW